jgi:aldose 1-epimerase
MSPTRASVGCRHINVGADFTRLSSLPVMNSIVLRACTSIAACGWAAGVSRAAEVQELKVGMTSARIAPSIGCNVVSFTVNGVEYLHGPTDPKAFEASRSVGDLSAFGFGVPIMYPMPNRVRDARFLFEGRTYSFKPNAGPNFMHGLVHSIGWEFLGRTEKPGSAAAHFKLDFKPGTKWYDAFPHRHTLKLTVRVDERSVRWEYIVDNTMGDKPVPFGFGLHPWFRYVDSRSRTVLTLPAESKMDAADWLPTGKWTPLEMNHELRKGRVLEGFVEDGLYSGLSSAKPATIDFQDRRMRLTLSASDDFKHVVVYTPPNQPYFCVENQTAATDAHNLFAQGMRDSSGLIVVPPGKSHAGAVEYVVTSR